VVGIHLDITQLKQAQLEASHAQRQLASFIEHAPAAVAMLDTELRYITHSQRWLHDYGLTDRQIVGLSHDEVFPDTAEYWQAIHHRCLHGAVEKCEEDALVRADGTCQWLRWEVRPWSDKNGEIGGIAMFTEDITHARELIVELEITRDKALAATRAKSDFLASMSHEIRTPMNAIFGMAELLNETSLTSEQQDYVQRFRKAGEHLLVLINDVLDLSKIESGHLELDYMPLDLDELIHAVGELMAGRATAQGLELLLQVAPDVPTSLIGDPSRLRQIIINLIGNAIKFTPSGEVIVEVQNDPDVPQPGRLRFSVRDTGIGIPAEKLHTVFESFTQVDASTTRQYGGTGLGLSISQHLVHLMEGEIAVESQMGAGSVFTFTAQFALDPEPQAQTTALAAEIHGLRILVIDDNATNRLILREILRYYGAVVTEAEGAEAGLLAWTAAQRGQQPFHIALVDCQMPAKDGFYFIEQVASTLESDVTAIFMLSSDNRPGDRARCRSLGVMQYLLKPISRRYLLRAIAESFNRPDSTPQPPMQIEESHDVAPGRSLHILVADDNEDNRMLFQSYIMKTPHQLDLAENGAVAVEKFQSDTYDLVFMDVQMPVMDGYRATAMIRQWEREYHRIPVRIIVLTANAFTEDVQKSLAAGCDRHLTKPIKKATLLAAIEEVASSPALTA
jgi:PAS domain S-box-containing protein